MSVQIKDNTNNIVNLTTMDDQIYNFKFENGALTSNYYFNVLWPKAPNATDTPYGFSVCNFTVSGSIIATCLVFKANANSGSILLMGETAVIVVVVQGGKVTKERIISNTSN